MGNTFSKKIENNGKIWAETFRNVKFGCLLSLALTLLKYRRAFTKNAQSTKEEKFKMQQHLFVPMLLYFARIPLFIAIFSIVFKKLIRMNYISTAMDINIASLSTQKYSISLMSFLLAYYMQQSVAIFHWKWSLLLLIRSLYSLIRLITPKPYKIVSIQDCHTVLAPLMGVFFICRYSKFLPQSIMATYRACYGFDRQQYIDNWACNNRKQPPCTSTVSLHTNINHNCFMSCIYDSLFKVFPHSFSFFIKLHLVAAMFGGMRFVKKLKTKPVKLFFSIIKSAVKSVIYWAFGVQLAVRMMSCFGKMVVPKLHALMDILMGTRNETKYEYVNEKNTALLFVMTGMVGRYNILSEPKGRRSEIVIALCWYEVTQLIRMMCNLETFDDDKYHWFLGSNAFGSGLLAACAAITMYVYCRDATYLKSMERTLIQNYLMQ